MIEQIKQAKDWESRYRLIIQAGKNLTAPEDPIDWTEISGCEAKLIAKISQNPDRTLSLNAYSEARIVNGLLWLLIQELNGKPIAEVQDFDLTAFFDELGIAQRLSATRLNGLGQIVERVKKHSKM